MKNTFKFLGIIAIAAIIGFGFTACDDGGGGGSGGGCNASCLAIGATGEGGGKIIYHKHSGFKVTGAGSFIAYYLEAAPVNQGTSLEWASDAWTSESHYYNTNIAGTGTAIGKGRANTAAILAVDANAPAAKATKVTIGEKSDWFLPSKDELIEMYKARYHLDTSIWSDYYFWSSSQYDNRNAWSQYFGYSNQNTSTELKYETYRVRAVRAF